MDEAESLSTVSTEAILKELAHRHDHGAFVALKVGYSAPDMHAVRRAWWGNGHTVAGLCLDLAKQAIDGFCAGSTTQDPRGET